MHQLATTWGGGVRSRNSKMPDVCKPATRDWSFARDSRSCLSHFSIQSPDCCWQPVYRHEWHAKAFVNFYAIYRNTLSAFDPKAAGTQPAGIECELSPGPRASRLIAT